MKKILISILSVLALVLAGCGGDKGAEEQAQAPASEAMPSAPAEEMAAEMGATIDHSQDEQKFMLRRSIGGLERMIEQYKADGYDSAELESSLQEATAELGKLTGS